MEFKEYQREARRTAVYDMLKIRLIYPTMGLCGEAGEFANKVKKIYRDKGGLVPEDVVLELKKELGDVLWYVSNCASDLGLKLEDIARDNIKKLKQRFDKSKIKGGGDNR